MSKPSQSPVTIIVLALFFSSGELQAQQCPPPGVIPNFRQTASTAGALSVAWDAPAGAPVGQMYDVVQATYSGFCKRQEISPRTVVATTTATSFSFPLSTPNVSYEFSVRLAGSPCQGTGFVYVHDTFTSTPTKPAITSAVGGAGTITITYSYSDERTFGISGEYTGADGRSGSTGFSFFCDKAQPITFVDYGSNGSRTAGGKIPAGTYQYRLCVLNRAGRVCSDPVSVTVTAPGSGQLVTSFIASPSIIRAGQSTTLLFSTTNAASVSIDNGVTVSGTSGSVTVSPAQTTTYTLTARGDDGSTTTAQVTVTVITAPAVIVSAFPQGLLQPPNTGGATDRISLTNAGGSSTTITLTQSGNFFTLAPTTLTLAPGATASVTITATAQQPGSYQGAVTASGAGLSGTVSIPVRLLVASPPEGTVTPTPKTNRVDVSQPTGSVEITNSGSATLQGILVSDAPWLIPPGGVVTIAPGQTITVTFSIDQSKRPDGASPIGAVSGFLTLVYLDGTRASQSRGLITSLNGAAPTQSTKIAVVNLVTPLIATTAIPPLASGELALFLPGLAKKSNLLSDITLVNTAPAPQGDLRLFFAQSGSATGSALQATIPSLIPSGKALFSDVVKGVFGKAEGQVGSVQVRGSKVSSLNLAAVATNPANSAGLFSGAIASQRSDRGVAANQKTTLSGVRKDSGTRTDVYIQEVAGQAGSVRTDFLAEDGTVMKTRPDTLSAFSVLELANEAPAGAAAVVVTNLAGSSRIVAQATVFDERTGDPTNLVDWNRRNGTAATDTQIVLFATSTVGGGKRTRTDLWITNTGTTSATGTLLFHGAPGRQRVAGRTTGTRSSAIEPMATQKVITVESGKTRILRDVLVSELGITGTGYLSYTPTSGTVAISSGTFRDPIDASPAAFGSSGTSVPVMATSTGIKLGESRQFSSLEDASAASVATAERATYQTAFGLIETTGKSVMVKLTLRYQAPVPGGLATFSVSNSKEYVLAPRASIHKNEIGREIFGAGRDSQGDLHDLVLEVSVTSGEGRVIPYVLATENGSGDLVLRIE
ncbi:MAG TPA: hypothetical protein VNM92_03775 [Thermoanaerobaculia bacterium]|nr:hypothetical protein [Thermoanaerobaculia bacterium]